MKKFPNSDWLRAGKFQDNTVLKRGNPVIYTESLFLELYYFFHVYYELVIGWFLVQFGKTNTCEFFKDLK